MVNSLARLHEYASWSCCILVAKPFSDCLLDCRQVSTSSRISWVISVYGLTLLNFILNIPHSKKIIHARYNSGVRLWSFVNSGVKALAHKSNGTPNKAWGNGTLLYNLGTVEMVLWLTRSQKINFRQIIRTVW